MSKIIRYEIMERDTRERLMFDMETLLKLDEGWEPVGGVAVAHYLEESGSRTAVHGVSIDSSYWITRKYLQAVILYK